jgi:nucleotide-binding universal stress UspA family protein
LRLLHVVEPVHAPYVFAARIDPDAVYQAELENFNRATTGLTEIAAGDRVMRRGVAADTIAEEAAGWAADVVVLGSHGKGWVERLLVGTATERLMTLLPASLLIVPARPAERPADWPAREVREPKGMIVI